MSEVWAIIGTVAGSVFALGLLIGGFGYFWSTFIGGRNQKKSDATEYQQTLDKTLKEVVAAQNERFLLLEADHKENIKEVGRLQGVVEEQSKQQQWFESIFVDALKSFFAENPALAIELDAKIKASKLPRR